ncbi:MAG: putative urea ABC transporter substrate-binding protein [Candidatus Andeanibacterium colombiense]|uniref:Urea ABC transporter substrate-binding protein n=1 Tax=Candidatus Andeanibacterium colombiense TaxID=3121345 RepID=A0AAJ5X553_9SPHN|nr:MAG: putative urea ABC transporter substrate-binding protein [Sphingomonadaceae bacterium]
MGRSTLVNRRNLLKLAGALPVTLALGACGKFGGQGADAKRTEFQIGWSIYTGFMPWYYANQAGIVQKWAKKFGITITMVQVNDYVESINQYTAGKLDGVLATTMDALTIPAAGGRDTSVIIIGDYSNGNDGIVVKNGKSVRDLAGRRINLVELSVSHYLLARALEEAGMKLTDIKTINTSDADMISAFATPEVTAVVAWNPQLAQIRKEPGAVEIFDSSKIPNEILDVMNVSTETLKANPDLGKALAGIWYETMEILHKGDAQSETVIEQMAKGAGTTAASLKEQLATTYLYRNPADAANYAENPDLITVTDRVRQFSFAQGLFGPAATSVDAIGIEFPGGKVLGDKNQIKLRFDPTYMKMAATGF